MSHVGTYTFIDNATNDSLIILTPGEKIPGLKSVSGLEVIIHDIGEMNTINYLTNYPDLVVEWKIYLIAWPNANGSTITDAGSIILEHYIGSKMIGITSAGVRAGALTQSLITVPSSGIII